MASCWSTSFDLSQHYVQSLFLSDWGKGSLCLMNIQEEILFIKNSWFKISPRLVCSFNRTPQWEKKLFTNAFAIWWPFSLEWHTLPTILWNTCPQPWCIISFHHLLRKGGNNIYNNEEDPNIIPPHFPNSLISFFLFVGPLIHSTFMTAPTPFFYILAKMKPIEPFTKSCVNCLYIYLNGCQIYHQAFYLEQETLFWVLSVAWWQISYLCFLEIIFCTLFPISPNNF